jgi:hypothetical protein
MVGKKPVYKISPLSTHVKQCVHELMEITADNKVVYHKYLFTPDNYKCGGCNSSDDVVFMRVSPINEVMRSCTWCGVTQPVSIKDDRNNIVAEEFTEESHVMTLDEIKDFLERNQIVKPFIPDLITEMLKTKRVKRNVKIDELGLETE